MKKALQLKIDQVSWAKALPSYRKTCPFAPNQTAARIDFLRAMLWIGVMSVPIQIPRWWVASHWAVLRYLGAADHSTPRLRLHRAIDDLDSHHKTALSDDWGVGLSLQWLAARLGYKHVVHGAFAMQALRVAGIAQFVRRRKRGPFKCPDFFAVDRQNKIHLIECKGNQAGPTHIDKQFQRGRQQKQNIRFRNESLVAQRLLCGVAIAGPTSRWRSTLKVADPPPSAENNYYDITSETHPPLVKAFKKVLLAQGLIGAGAAKLAHEWFPAETAVEDESILAPTPTTPFEAQGGAWQGIVYELKFPVMFRLDDGGIAAGCRLRFGASIELLSKLRSPQRTPVAEEQVIADLDMEIPAERERDHGADVEGTHVPSGPSEKRATRRATIRQGQALFADLELLEA